MRERERERERERSKLQKINATYRNGERNTYARISTASLTGELVKTVTIRVSFAVQISTTFKHAVRITSFTFVLTLEERFNIVETLLLL